MSKQLSAAERLAQVFSELDACLAEVDAYINYRKTTLKSFKIWLEQGCDQGNLELINTAWKAQQRTEILLEWLVRHRKQLAEIVEGEDGK